MQIQEILDNLCPQPQIQRRSLNFIGSAWKWIAGNPDHDDLTLLTNQINNVLTNNNKQVIINELYKERINNITQITNEILKTFHEEDSVQERLIIESQNKIRMIKEELVNIKYAIHWAKAGIINSMIVSKKDISLVRNTLDRENLPYSSNEEALELASIKILSNSTFLLYVITFPITKKETYQKLLIRPIKKDKIINKINFNVILKCKQTILGLTKDCKSCNNVAICKQDSILDIRHSTCIPHLLQSHNSTCVTINNHHIPTSEEIEPGIIYLNQYNNTIVFGNTSRRLEGTFLIKFHNETIKINNRLFTSKEESTLHPVPAITQPKPTILELQEYLSLEMLKELHINNTEKLQLLQSEKRIHQWTTYGIISLVASLLIMIIANKTKRTSRVIIHQEPKEKQQKIAHANQDEILTIPKPSAQTILTNPEGGNTEKRISKL